jgi:hypothetical protein
VSLALVVFDGRQTDVQAQRLVSSSCRMDTCCRIYTNTDSSQKSGIVLISGRNRRQIAEIGRSDKVFDLPILF